MCYFTVQYLEVKILSQKSDMYFKMLHSQFRHPVQGHVGEAPTAPHQHWDALTLKRKHQRETQAHQVDTHLKSACRHNCKIGT